MVEAVKTNIQSLDWHGIFNDDCAATWKNYQAHAEHLSGPQRGGIWYCSVSDAEGGRYFHTADRSDIQPKNGVAARWLCELVVSAAEQGVIEKCAD